MPVDELAEEGGSTKLLDDEKLRQALNAVISERYQRYYRAVLRQVGNEADAADLIQEAFLIATASLSKFRGESMLSSWVFGIAKNVVRAHRRRRVPLLFEEMSSCADTDALDALMADPRYMTENAAFPDPLDSLLAREKLRCAGDAIENLKPETREALWNAITSDVDYDELARRLGVPTGTLKSRVSRGRSSLRDSLKQAGLD
ncbi:MAG: RNA polymerase sigma factor [Janthinobacterium lividum]